MQRNEAIEKEIERDLDKLIQKVKCYYEIDENSDINNSSKRIIKMFSNELLKGYYEDPKKFLKYFQSESDNVFLKIQNIPIKSLCEHHFLPMYGYADIIVKYKKGAKVLGLSKYYRIVDNFCRKFQLQEKLTQEIADFFYENLNLEGIIVKLKCDHFCVKMRGANVETGMTTSIVAKGIFENNFMQFIKE